MVEMIEGENSSYCEMSCYEYVAVDLSERRCRRVCVCNYRVSRLCGEGSLVKVKKASERCSF